MTRPLLILFKILQNCNEIIIDDVIERFKNYALFMKRLSVFSLLLLSCVFLVKTQAYGGILGFGKADPENPFVGKLLLDVFEKNENQIGVNHRDLFDFPYYSPKQTDFSQYYLSESYKVRRDFLAFNSSSSVTIKGINFTHYIWPLITDPENITYSVKDNTITFNFTDGRTRTLFFEKKGKLFYFKDGLVGAVFTFIELPDISILTDTNNSELWKIYKDSRENYDAKWNTSSEKSRKDEMGRYLLNKMIHWMRSYIQSIEPSFSNTFAPSPNITPVPTPTPFPKLTIPDSKTYQFIFEEQRLVITNYFKDNDTIRFEGFAYKESNGSTSPITGYFEDKILEKQVTYDSSSIKCFVKIANLNETSNYDIRIVFSLNRKYIKPSDVRWSDLQSLRYMSCHDITSNKFFNGAELITNGSMTLLNLISNANSMSMVEPHSVSSNEISSNSSPVITDSESTHQFESNRSTSTEASKPIDTNTTSSLPFNSDYSGNIVNSESGNKSSISLTISSTSQSYSPNHIPIHGKLVMSNGKTDDGFNGYFDSTSSPKSFSLGWDNSQGTMEMNGKVIDSSLIATWRIKTKPEGKIVSGTIDASKQ